MNADIQIYNCLGRPIEIQVRGKRNLKYRATSENASTIDKVAEPYGPTKRSLLEGAAYYREHPDSFADTAEPGEDVEAMCEWAFIIEQLVAEGSL